MNFSFSPYLRYIAKSSHYIRNKSIIARDCRFLYIISGTGAYYAGRTHYDLRPGALIYYPYGVAYKIRSSKEDPLYFYAVNFDFNEEYRDITTMVPQPETLHRPENELRSIDEDLQFPFSDVIYIKNAVSIESNIRKMFDEYVNTKPGSDELANSYLKIILTQIYRYTIRSADNSLCQKIKELAVNCPELNNNDIAHTLNYNPVYLNTLFKKTEGTTLHKFILRTRLSKAREMITETQMSLSAIADACGFSSQAHLSTAFKNEYNISPMLIRKQT